MGLMDKISGDSMSTTPVARPSQERKVDEGRSQQLMDAIEESGVPSNVILLTEKEFTRGGRQVGDSVGKLIFGTIFCAIPLFGIIGMAVGGALVFLPCLLIITIPFFWFGGRILQGSIQNLFYPEPLEDVHTIYWFDERHRFIAVVEHTSDPETGQEFYPESLGGLYLKSSDEIAILYDPPSEGAMTPGSRRVCLWDPHSQEESFVLLNLEWFSYYDEEEARDRARYYSRKLGLKFNLETDDTAEYNMDVINPEGGLMFIRR